MPRPDAPAQGEVRDLIERLRIQKHECGERVNHRMRRYLIERHEAAKMLEALIAHPRKEQADDQ